jgi:hypothetical protein
LSPLNKTYNIINIINIIKLYKLPAKKEKFINVKFFIKCMKNKNNSEKLVGCATSLKYLVGELEIDTKKKRTGAYSDLQELYDRHFGVSYD